MHRLDRFLTTLKPDDPRAVRQGRILVASAFSLSAVLTLAVGLRMLVAPLHPVALAAGLAVVGLSVLVPWILRATGSLTLASGLLVGGVFISLVIAAGFIGGLEGPALVLSPLVPLLATFLLGRRAGGWTAAGLILLIVLCAGLPRWGVTFPDSPFKENEAIVARAIMLTAAIMLTTVLASLYEDRRSRAERRFEQSQELYRQLFEQSKDIVALTRPDGRLVDINQAGFELYGYGSRAEMLRRPISETYVDPEERRRLLDLLDRDGFVRNYESLHRTVDGDLRVVQGTTTTIRDDGGAVEYLLAILRDVTEEKKQVEEREAMLAELAAKNRALERFTGAVSHDLKSPLLTIRGFLELVGRDAETGDLERMQADMSVIHGAVEKMQRLIDGLLELAKMQRSTVTKVDLGELARETVGLLAGRMRQVGVTVEISDDLPTVDGDPTLLRIILQNLLDNALKAVQEVEEPRVGVAVRDAKTALTILVADNGVGIAAEDQDRIFELFEKLDAEVEGTGLGLAGVRQAVDAHGGQVWVESEGVGRGAVFCFTLGLRRQADRLPAA